MQFSEAAGSIIILSGFQTWNFIRKRLQDRCLPLNIAKFLRTSIWRTYANDCFWIILWKRPSVSPSVVRLFAVAIICLDWIFLNTRIQRRRKNISYNKGHHFMFTQNIKQTLIIDNHKLTNGKGTEKSGKHCPHKQLSLEKRFIGFTKYLAISSLLTEICKKWSKIFITSTFHLKITPNSYSLPFFWGQYTAQKMKLSIKDFFKKCDQN